MKRSTAKASKAVAALLGAVLLVGAFGATAAAAPGAQAGDPGRPAGQEGDIPGVGPNRPSPELTDEQKEILARAEGLVEDMEGILDEASDAAAAQDYDGAETALLAYVSTMSELEACVNEFAATVPEGKPFPFRAVFAGIIGGVTSQMSGFGQVWQVLPAENQAPVRDAVRAAVEAGTRRAFWRGLVGIVRSGAGIDPGKIRERLEAALARVQENLEWNAQRTEHLNEVIAKLEEKIASTEDPKARERFEERKHIAELDLAVCEARQARDEYAIECLKDWLSQLPPEGGQ